MPRFPNEIEYGEKYCDDFYEYRHVMLPKHVFNSMPKSNLSQTLTETEWRSLGIQQSRGWIHYQVHRPEPYILLFRRPKGTDPTTGLPPRGFKTPDDQLGITNEEGDCIAVQRRQGHIIDEYQPPYMDQFRHTH